MLADYSVQDHQSYRASSVSLGSAPAIAPTSALDGPVATAGDQQHELRHELRALPGTLVAAVNTHGHWDHAFGNARFADVPIWGHVRMLDLIGELARLGVEVAAGRIGIGAAVRLSPFPAEETLEAFERVRLEAIHGRTERA